MRRLILLAPAFLLLAFGATGWAQSSDFTISVHIFHSETMFVYTGTFNEPIQTVDAIIDGHKVKMISTKLANSAKFGIAPSIFKCGDYKARISKEKIVDAAQYTREYELQIPDGGTVKFYAIGESE